MLRTRLVLRVGFGRVEVSLSGNRGPEAVEQAPDPARGLRRGFPKGIPPCFGSRYPRSAPQTTDLVATRRAIVSSWNSPTRHNRPGWTF